MLILTSAFIQGTIISSWYMSILDSNPEIRRACRLSGTLFHTAPTRTAQIRRDCILSGRLESSSILCETDESRPRVCVPMSDAIDRGMGEGVEEILSMKKGGRAQEL